MAYFKQSIQEDVPTIVKIAVRFQPKPDEGYGPKFPYTIVWNGTEYTHEATMTEEKTLQKFQVGQEAQVTKKKNSHGTLSMFWNEVPRGAPAMNQAPAAPLPVAPKKEEVDWDRIADSKIIHNFMLAFIEQGKTPEECKALAVKCHKLQEQAVTEVTTGIPPVPTHSPALVAAVNDAFGSDDQIPLPDSQYTPETYNG